MKTYSIETIDYWRNYFEKQKYPQRKAAIDGLTFRYYVIPQEQYPELPDFAFRMIGEKINEGHLFGVSASVDDVFRDYWAFHEVVEFLELRDVQEGRCRSALERELKVVPPALLPKYVPRRRDFFERLMAHAQRFPQHYGKEDVAEFQQSLQKLKEMCGHS